MTKARDISKLLSTANGKIAGANLDVSFENISDSGTAGTKVASGTTGQRGSTAGQIRFNTTTGLAEYYTGTEFKVIDSPPTITAVSPLLVDSNAGGNVTFTITGSNFQSGAVIKFVGNDATEITASTTTVNSSSSISAIIARSSFVNAKEPYDVRVINTSGLSGTLDNQISVDTTVAWSTASGSLGTLAHNASGNHYTLSATDADSDTITYSVFSGALPTGLSLNSSTGVISGTLNNTGATATSTFTIRASTTDANADRSFSITVSIAPYSVDFLVIGGGGTGSGGNYATGAGGGGAGGYRSSNATYGSSGGGGSAEASLTFNGGTVYTITVGAGGTNTYGSETQGINSSISGTGLTTITSLGGGWGAGFSNRSANSGGSGGGGSYTVPTGASGTANQGYAGGNSNDVRTGGGGGGAGGTGGGSSAGNGGNGGNGVASTITGSSVTRAGGGGGGSIDYSQATTFGTGGSGGGGNGGDSDTAGNNVTVAINGTVNTGSGGGGATGNSSAVGGSGGKGVVILRMPTSKYSGTTTGSPTVTQGVGGTDTVLIFNDSGSYTG